MNETSTNEGYSVRVWNADTTESVRLTLLASSAQGAAEAALIEAIQFLGAGELVVTKVSYASEPVVHAPSGGLSLYQFLIWINRVIRRDPVKQCSLGPLQARFVARVCGN